MIEFVREARYPDEVLVDPDKATKAIFLSMVNGIFASPSMVESFQHIDQTYTADKADRLRFMAKSVMPLGGFRPNIGGAQLDTSFVHDTRNANAKSLLVVTSPLNDGRPLSSAETMADFVDNISPSRAEIRKAQPNSWGPATKLDATYELLHAEGMDMPALQLYSRVAPWLFTAHERASMIRGDFRPYGRAVVSAIQAAEQRKHEVYGTGGFDEIHFFGAGIPQKAIGAAQHLTEHYADDYNVKSVTAMNLVLDQKAGEALRNYGSRRMVGEASDLILPEGFSMVPEPQMRRDIEPKGVELAMRTRQVRAMLDLSVTLGMLKSGAATAAAFETLMQNGTHVTVANGSNEGMTERTSSYLPGEDSLFNYIDLVGVEGKKVGMAANEHVGAVAVVAAQGIRNSLPN